MDVFSVLFPDQIAPFQHADQPLHRKRREMADKARKMVVGAAPPHTSAGKSPAYVLTVTHIDGSYSPVKLLSINDVNLASESAKTDGTLQTFRFRTGDFVEYLCCAFYWSKLHIMPRELDKLRLVGDDLADEALHELQLKAREDPLPRILTCFSNQNAKHPRLSGGTSTVSLCRHLMSVPEWVDWGSIRRGQQFFIRNAAGCGIALLFLSLTGGFGAPKINKVLNSTGYLSQNCASTYVRLFETLQMIVDCMSPGGLTPGVGEGWKSCIRVRFLHAKVRRRLLSLGKWDKENWGVPINQEDLSVTLVSFQAVVLEALKYMGASISEAEREDYTHLWRLIGHYSGVLPQNNPCKNFASSRAAAESYIIHLVRPDSTSAILSKHMLESAAGRAPFFWTYEMGAQLSRMLMGHGLADRLALPQENRWYRQLHLVHFCFIRCMVRLTWVPFLGSRIMELQLRQMKQFLVTVQGGKRTKFGLKKPPTEHFIDEPKCPIYEKAQTGSSFFARICFMWRMLGIRYSNKALLKTSVFLLTLVLFWKKRRTILRHLLLWI